MARRGRFLIRALILAILAWLAGAYWVSGRLVTPTRLGEPRPPFGDDLVAESISLTTDDGLAIAAWVVEPTEGEPGAVCLLLHPTDGRRSASRATWAVVRGMAVVTLDSRGHGGSEGDRTGFGWSERAEVRAAVTEARRRWPDLPLVGWGTSLGAAALVYAVDPAHPDSLPPGTFSALVLESLYADIETAFLNRVDVVAGRWALPIALPVRWFTLWRTGLDPRQLEPERSLERITAAAEVDVLLATGSLDRLSTPAELQRLAAASGGRAVLVDGGRHADLMGKDDGAWLEALSAFLERWGRPSPPTPPR